MSNSKIANAPQKSFSCPELETAVLQCRFIKGKKTDYYCGRVLKLSNLNHDFVLKKKQFCQLWLHKSGVFDNHHAVVASDGMNEDMIIDYTSPLVGKIVNLIPSPVVNYIANYIIGGLTGIIVDNLPITLPIVGDIIKMASADFVAQSVIDWVESKKLADLRIEDFKGDKRQLVRLGTVETTYDQLKDTAMKIFKKNPRCTFSFDSRNFCQMFLQVSLPHMHKADVEKAKEEAVYKDKIKSYEEPQLRALIWPNNSIV